MENMLRNILRTWGTYWELNGNALGTREILPPPYQNSKGKKASTLSACLVGLPIVCMKFLFPKEFITIFA
jgi:hypothetical protein